MITAIKERATVKENGTVEISALDLPVGTAVEVIILVEEEMDTTEYLLSTEANREHLMKSLEEMNHPESFVRFDSVEDLEKFWKK